MTLTTCGGTRVYGVVSYYTCPRTGQRMAVIEVNVPRHGQGRRLGAVPIGAEHLIINGAEVSR